MAMDKTPLLTAALLAMILSGCAAISKQVPQETVDPTRTQARFQADQERRLAQLSQWQTSGILELSTERGKRRLRAELRGEKSHQAVITIFGPMRNIAAIIFAGSQEIRLTDPDKGQIIEVPATKEGLKFLVGFGFDPNTLIKTLTAVAENLTQADTSRTNSWFTEGSEQLVVDPETGLILERLGQTQAGEGYHVFYQWDKTITLNNPGLLPMPSQVKVMIPSEETQLTYKGKQWQVPPQPFADHWFDPLVLYPEFSLAVPAGEDVYF